MMNDRSHPTEIALQEEMWIEIIRSMEAMYAGLAATQIEMERKNAELLAANEFVRNVIRSMISALIVSDRHGRVTLTNDACARSLGCSKEDIVGKPLETFFAPGAKNAIHPGTVVWTLLEEIGALRDVETEVLLADGQAIPVSVNVSIMSNQSGEMDGVLLVASDQRPLKKALSQAKAEAEERARAYVELEGLQSKLIQSEKMSSLGRMAAGVAHEINNPLGAILVYTHLLLEDTPDGEPQRDILLKVIRETNRCKGIVQELLGFSRARQGKRRVLELGKILLATLEIIRAQPVFQSVARRLEIAEEPMHVEAEQSLLQQALMNILVNAAEAMEGAGTISIRTWSDAERQTANVSISDTGPGIPPELVDQLFEPFFTTKDEGHGTGLGLSIAYHIIREHGGGIDLKSAAGGGARFDVSLPLRSAEGGEG